MNKESANVLPAEKTELPRSVRLSRIILPMILGAGAIVYLFWRQFDPQEFAAIHWSAHTFTWISIGVLTAVTRDVAYATRLRVLTNREFSWWKCFEIIIIWEFSSAVSPTSIGGSAVAFFILAQEKMPMARTITIVLYTIVLDSLFMLLTLPILFAVFGYDIMRPGAHTFADTGGWGYYFLTFYGIKLGYAIVFFYGLFINPQQLRRFLGWLTNNWLLRRIHVGAVKLGDDLLIASQGLWGQPWRYHLQAAMATATAWVFRFLLISCLIIAFVPTLPLTFTAQFELYARLQTMYFMIMFSPTPGGAGLIELLFGGFLTDYISSPTLSTVVSTIWRLLSYYLYLLAGALVIPNWLRNRTLQTKNAE